MKLYDFETEQILKVEDVKKLKRLEKKYSDQAVGSAIGIATTLTSYIVSMVLCASTQIVQPEYKWLLTAGVVAPTIGIGEYFALKLFFNIKHRDTVRERIHELKG